MTTQNYLQIGTNKIINIRTYGSFASIDNGDNIEVYIYLESKGLFLKNDYFLIKTNGLLISSQGEIYRLYGGEQPPTEPSYLLLEDGDFVLLEDESKILLQR